MVSVVQRIEFLTTNQRVEVRILSETLKFINMKRFKSTQLDYMEKSYREKDRKRRMAYWGSRYYRNFSRYSIWHYMDAVLHNSIGRNLDEVVSKIIAYAKINHKASYYVDVLQDIANCFDNHPSRCFGRHYKSRDTFTLDSQKRIQYSDYYKKSRLKVIPHKYKVIQFGREVKFKEYLLFSKSKFRLITKKTHPESYQKVFEQYAEHPHLKTYYVKDGNRYPRSYELVRDDVMLEVSRRKYLQIHAENKQRRKLQDIDIKKTRKQKQYSMLTRVETQLKKEKELDALKLLSHGFDDESFKGEHYHGQKRKKKNV